MKVQNFSERLEADLTRLGQEVQARKERQEGGAVEEKNIVKESLKTMAEGSEASQSTPQVSDNLSSKDEDYLPAYLSNASGGEEMKRAVEHLLELTLEKGIQKAVAVARRANPFIEDAFHDALADKLIPELKKRGIFN